MTKEEAKKMGATHCDRIGYYFKYADGKWFVYSKITGLLSSEPYALTQSQIELYGVKPL